MTSRLLIIDMKTKFEDRQVRIFISSTFRGMGNEREVLVRHVFPEIRRRCFERGVDFVEVDLRWGITKEQVDLGNAVPICFQQIDKCYPYFLSLLDEYYGSTIPPEQRKIACAGYPWIEDHLDRSITELEILYALFYSDPKRSVKRQAVAEKALFYFLS